jgi:hypothetical protein
MFKSRLQKKEGLTHTELKVNITNIIKDIPISKYVNIFQGAYNRSKTYVKKTLTRKRISKMYKT